VFRVGHNKGKLVLSEISGWAMAHRNHPVDPPLINTVFREDVCVDEVVPCVGGGCSRPAAPA
jgi:hypothetical protein